MNFNLKCDIFKNNLLNIINENQLPIAATYYILKDIFFQIENLYIGTINQAVLNEQQNTITQFKEENNIKEE